MSAGGVFKLIANDGKADRMIMATELLNQRIEDIMCERQAQGYADTTPTLVDIERTHILYVNAHFKPFAAIAYEYNKVRPQSGSNAYGSSLQFSIPQFGDFFNDMALNIGLAATSATTGTVPAFPGYIGANDQSSSSTASISAVNNATDGIYTKYTYEYVNAAGVVQTVGAAATNFVRYCEYPGQRICKKIKFDVNGNPLDEYTAEAMLFYQKFRVMPNKAVGWARLVGQEVPREAYSDLLSINGAANYPAAAANLTNQAGAAVVYAAQNATNTARQVTKILDGPQTPKATQPALDMWIPLLFWFNCNPALSIASVSIPYGQRFISVDLEAQDKILFTAPGNLFLRLTTEVFTSAGTNKGLANAVAVSDYKKYVNLTPVLASNSTIDTTQQISYADLYINNLFVNPEIHDIYIKRIGFSLIRVHRYQQENFAVSTYNVWLSQLKWPIETMYVGLRPVINVDASNANQHRDWHRLTRLTDNQVEINAKAHSAAVIDDTLAWNAAGAKLKNSTSQEQVMKLTYPVEAETVDTLQLQAHGINIYQTLKSAFYRDYQTFIYGGPNIVTPEDKGALMINFCLHPGTYQPSGHINISRAREFYLTFVSSYVSSSNNAQLLVLAIALNFLLISDGSAVLRYTT